MTLIRGYWKVKIEAEYFDGSKVGLEEGDTDLEHINNMISQGYTEGELIKEVQSYKVECDGFSKICKDFKEANEVREELLKDNPRLVVDIVDWYEMEAK